jgi:hypothetical protein
MATRAGHLLDGLFAGDGEVADGGRPDRPTG